MKPGFRLTRRDDANNVHTFQVGAQFEALIVGVGMAPFDSRYTWVGFNFISDQVCPGVFSQPLLLSFFTADQRRQLTNDHCSSSTFLPFLSTGDEITFFRGTLPYEHPRNLSLLFLFWKFLPELRAELCGAAQPFFESNLLLWNLFFCKYTQYGL